MTSRAELIADTAIAVLAERGMRGLTHRAVDEVAGLPPGSTSNHARTRAALLEAAMARMVEHEAADLASVLTPGGVLDSDNRPETTDMPDVTRAPDTTRADDASTGDMTRTGDIAGASDVIRADNVARAGDVPDPGDPGPGDPGVLAAVLAAVLHHQLTNARTRLLARYEFALEATRRPELRTIYDEAGRGFREPAAGLLAAAGSTDPERHGRMLITWCEGVQFDAIAGAGWSAVPSYDELHADLRQLLRAMLDR